MTVFIRQVVGVFLFICFLVYVFYTGHIPGQTLWSQVSAVSLTDLKQGVVAQNLTEVDFNMLKNEIDFFRSSCEDGCRCPWPPILGFGECEGDRN